MDGYRHTVRTGGIPHRVEAAVINFYQRPTRNALAQVEAKSLQQFQASRSEFLRSSNLICLKLRIVGLRNFFEPWLSKYYKPVGMRLLPIIDGLLEHLSIAAGEIHHQTHVLPIHHAQNFFGR